MKTLEEEGWSAFPRPVSQSDDFVCDAQKGMTLRDWFAGQALPGLFPESLSNVKVAKIAYEIADEMLKARKA